MIRIGNIELPDRPLLLAPMEDVTDRSFRSICKNFGADMVYTEFIASDGLIRNVKQTLQKLILTEHERPAGIQLYGHLTDSMVEAAKLAEAAGPELIDINFGCPVKKIANRGAGAGMLANIPRMIKMTESIVRAVKLPVTVKTRIGWDDNSKNIVEIAERLQDTGISAITIHGRTRAQLYKGNADWTLKGEVKNNPRMKIPVIGNGDITSPEDALRAFDKYGVDGIMIGRAAIGMPWIFRDIKSFFKTGVKTSPPEIAERVEIARHHFRKSLEVKGEKVGILEMRRHFALYFKSLPNFRETRLKLLTSTDPVEIEKILDLIIITYQNH
jgi:nifR3 family TIM-barrel protein